jgi:hypothetical protein
MQYDDDNPVCPHCGVRHGQDPGYQSRVFAVYSEDVARFLADETGDFYQQEAQTAIREELAACVAGKEITACAYGHEPFTSGRPPVAFVIAVVDVSGTDVDVISIATANFCSHCADQMTREHLIDLSMQMTETLTDGLRQRPPTSGRLH